VGVTAVAIALTPSFRARVQQGAVAAAVGGERQPA
jgi:hypothetical protein